MTHDKDDISRRRFVTAAGTAGLAGVAGCLSPGGDSGSSNNQLEIAHWWAEGDGNAAINSVIEGFKEEYPDVELNENLVSGGAGENLRDNIRTRIQNGNHPSTWQSWPGKELTPFVEADLLKDIESSVWDKNDMKSAYLEGVKQAAKPGGSYVTVPINIHRLNNLFYSVEVIEQAGVDPSNAENPSALLDMMVQIDDATDAAPMANQTAAPWSTLQLWAQVLLGEHGVDMYTSFTEGEISANEDAIRSSLQTVASYSDYFNEDAGSISWTEANSQVINGNAAFIHQGDWAAGAYRGTDDFSFKDDWDHVPFPGTSGMYALNMDSFPYPVDNPSPDAATKFLRYLGTVDAQERFNPKKGSIPPRTDVPDDAFGPFLTRQKGEFAESDAQPPSITHGLGVDPETLSNLKSAISTFTADWNVDKTYSQIESSF